MGDSTVRILLVEDNPGDARLLRETLRDAEGLPFELTHVERLDEAIQRLETQAFDVLLLDLSLPDSQGTDTVKRMTAVAPHIPVVVLTGTDDEAVGTESVAVRRPGLPGEGPDRPPAADAGHPLRHRAQAGGGGVQGGQGLSRTGQSGQGPFPGGALPRAANAADARAGGGVHAPKAFVPGAADARTHLEMIRRNVELEARLIDDLLDVTRIARGKMELDRQPVELCTVIHRAVEVCRPDIEARRLDFGHGPRTDSPVHVQADIARLQQVFWNLLKNAIKFTPTADA